MSEISIRPPGLSTRKISANTAGLSGERLTTQFETTQSTEPVATGSASMRPMRTSTLASPAAAALARARSIMASVMSTPMTRPRGPTF